MTPILNVTDYELIEIEYLVSTEINFVKTLKNFSDDYTNFQNNIFNKLFIDIDNNQHYILKNKYLYWTTKGALNYLEAIKAIKSYSGSISKKIDAIEIESVLKLSNDINNNISLVSLGCGDGNKDIKILNKLNSDYKQCKHYYPIDISSTLLFITIQEFISNELENKPNLYPINCNFFDFPNLRNKISNFSKNHFYNEDTNRIFTLFGQTFANYRELDLLIHISALMNPGDFLIIGIEPIVTNGEKENRDKYKNQSNRDFLINPLKWIPQYRGFADNPSTYLNFEFSILEEGNYKLTNVPDAKCLKATINIPGSIEDICLAWSTKYNMNSLKNWLIDNKRSLDLICINTNESYDYYCTITLKKVNKINDSVKRVKNTY